MKYIFSILLLVNMFSVMSQNVIVMPNSGSYTLKLGQSYMFYDMGGEHANYSNKLNQQFSLVSPINTHIEIEFVYFDIETNVSCSYDYLSINNGSRTDKYCSNPNKHIISDANVLEFNFRSDAIVNKGGWAAKVKVVSSDMFYNINVNNFVDWTQNPSFYVDFLNSDYVRFEVFDDLPRRVYASNWINTDFEIPNLQEGKYTVNTEVSYLGANIRFKHDLSISSMKLIAINKSIPESSMSPKQLVENVLVSGCLTAENIKYSGDKLQSIGFFEANNSNFPIKSGIVMSTGKISDVENNPNFKASGSVLSAPDDSDARKLTGNSAHDVQILEFDFIPAGDKLEFNYVFSSEEYPDYSCSAYNDVFAFILSGPGITPDPGYSGKNIALTPNGNNVSIKNVNDQGCGDANFYQDERQQGTTSFNGRTDVFAAKANVVPCKKYHIRLILADVQDGTFDSAVFLEANSFKSNEVLVRNGLGKLLDDKDIMYEGCDGSYIEFTRDSNFGEDFIFDITITGTATNGVDYVHTNIAGDELGLFPNRIVIPANRASIRYYYKAKRDSDIEGEEFFKISFLKSCPCSPTPEYYTKNVKIVDVAEVEASLVSNVQCKSGSPVATVTVQLKNGLNTDLYFYNFDSNGFKDNNVFTINNPTVDREHSVIVMDKFACNTPIELKYKIPPVVPILSHAGNDIDFCEKEELQLNGTGGIYYNWSCIPQSGEGFLSDTNISNPKISKDAIPGIYKYTLTVKESALGTAVCVSTDEVEIKIKEIPKFSINVDNSEVCSGGVVNINANVQNAASITDYQWEPIGDLSSVGFLNASTSLTTTSVIVKNYSLMLTNNNGCTARENLPNVFVYPNPIVKLNSLESNLCVGQKLGVLKLDVSGGSPFTTPLGKYNFNWMHGAKSQMPLIDGLVPGKYSVEVSDSKACKTLGEFEILPELKPKGVFFK